MAKVKVTLSDRPPVTVEPQDWPVIVWVTGDSYYAAGGADPARRDQARRRGEVDEYVLGVRRHADGRVLVFGVLDAAPAAWGAPARGESWSGGELLPAGTASADIAAAIRRVGESGGLPASLIRQAIAALPAEALE